MVRRKLSRATGNRAKPSKPDITLNEDAEAEQESLKKRLSDFDFQVRNILIKMEEEKQAIIESIKRLYFVDEQRTSPDINNMLWVDYLNKNTVVPKSEIRQSVAHLINNVENIETTIKKQRRKVANQVQDTPSLLVPPRTTRNTRRRGVNDENLPENPPPKARGRAKTTDTQVTPANKIRKLPASLLITPKFDPRTPLPASTLRKPKFGEIAVSLKGSPLQVAPKNLELDDIKVSDLDEKTREELQELHCKVSQLLQI